MQSIKNRIKLVKELENRVELSQNQHEESRKMLVAERGNLYIAMQDYAVEFISKAKWETDGWKNIYKEGRMFTKTDSKELFDFFEMEHIYSNLTLTINDLRFLLQRKDGGYVLGYIDSYEQVETLRSIGVEVRVATLVAIKQGLERRAAELQKDIDLWTLKKMEEVK